MREFEGARPLRQIQTLSAIGGGFRRTRSIVEPKTIATNMVIWLAMKTTLDLPDELLIEAKKRAAEQRRPLRALVEEGLRLALKQPVGARRRKVVHLVTVKGGLSPDLDLSNRAAMMDWIEKRG